ncbi:MAG: hypothetical protein QOH88_3142 [Verrucomicrobiota bacterium]|jgi:uncharacterized protein (DUF2235 family)
MVNIVIYSDGTGQRGGLLFDERRSNIYKLFRATRCGPDSTVDPAEQLTFYDPGLGTAPPGHEGSGLAGAALRAFTNLLSQATGLGLTRNIIDCYAALIRLWRPGDRIFLFGFSRGAYTVRCLSAVICLCGVPTRDERGQPLRRDEKTTQRIAEEGVKKVYQHTESRKTFKTERQRELHSQRAELGLRFREKYASGDAASPSRANTYPHFIGVFDTVASLAKPKVAVVTLLPMILLLALSSWGILSWLGFNIRFWIAFGVVAGGGVLLSWLGLIVSLIRFEFGLPRNDNWRPFHLTDIHMESYETDLSVEVSWARHAISIDECRKSFPRVPWGGSYSEKKTEPADWFEQRWFAGNHSDIGGSYPENESRLSDIPLGWMLEAAVNAGLKYDPSVLHLYPDPTGPQHDESRSSLFRWAPRSLRPIRADAPLHPSVLDRFNAAEVLDYDTMRPYRPENLRHHTAVKGYYS